MPKPATSQSRAPHPTESRSPHGFRAWAIIAGLSLLITALMTAAERQSLLDGSNLQAYDWIVRLQRGEASRPNVFNIDFDEDSVRRFSAFPIPRLLLADIINKVAAGKPSVIGLDVILDIPRVPADDARLAHVIDDAGNVVIISEYGFGVNRRNEPLPIFQQAAAGVAFADLPTDADGAVRRMFLRVTTTDYKALSLPVAVADLFSGQHLRPGGADFLLFGSRRLPLATTHPDTALIHFHPSSPTPVIPVEALLSNDFNASIFQGKIVLVGQSSEMGKDLFTTPVTRADVTIAGRNLLSGTEIHGAAIESLLAGNLLRTMAPFPRLLAGLALALTIILLSFRYRWHIALGLCLALAAFVLLTALILFSRFNLWTPFVSIEACLLAALPAGLGYRSVEERRLKNQMEAERRQLMGLFERYVSADVAAEIWKNRDSIVLAGEERVATILFSDIRSFTAMTAGVPSQQVLSWLNRYLTAMGEVVKKNRGFLNKFIGDGIMVVFGAPLSEGPREDAGRAVRCAVEMLASIDHWNATKPSGEPHLKIGIGIHSGPVTAGNVGSPDRLEYSVIGDTVNMASRLEALTKEFKTSLILSPATWEYVQGQFPTVSLGTAQVRGFANSISLYTVESQTAIEVHP
jgi:adenylate cyclase